MARRLPGSDGRSDALGLELQRLLYLDSIDEVPVADCSDDRPLTSIYIVGLTGFEPAW